MTTPAPPDASDTARAGTASHTAAVHTAARDADTTTPPRPPRPAPASHTAARDVDTAGPGPIPTGSIPTGPHHGWPRLPAFLSARWSNLILATYAVDPAILQPHVPPGCRLDLTADGRHALASLVAFDFLDCRVLGVPWPGFVNFPEVNLRFYVRYGRGDRERRGVCFVAEFVPQRTVAALARWTYNEPYRALDMHSDVTTTADTITVKHDLTVGGRPRLIRVVADAGTYRPADPSPATFLIEHQWGFGTSRFLKRLIRYQVIHPSWAVHRVRRFDLDWDWSAAYGPAFAGLTDARPVSVVLAAGSAVKVYPRGDLDPDRRPRPAVHAPPELNAPQDQT